MDITIQCLLSSSQDPSKCLLKDSLHFISTKYQQNELCLLPRSTTISSLACSFNISLNLHTIFSCFRNCKLAFETADLRLGITPLLDVSDVARDNRRDARARCAPDRLSILTYVSLFHHKFTHDARAAADSGISSPSPESGDSSR